MEMGRIRSRPTTENQAVWRTALKLIEKNQYDRVANILHKAQITNEQASNVTVASALMVACQICLVCSQCRDEMTRYQQAFEETKQREQELRHRLYAILNWIDEHTLSKTVEKHETPLNPFSVKVNTLNPNTSNPATRRSLRQRIHILLGGRTNHRSLKASSTLAQSPTRTLAKQTQGRGTLEIGQAEQDRPIPSLLVVHCLGPFHVYQNDQPIQDWPSGKGKAIFKYLITHRERPIPKEVLMEIFWPGAHPDAARNNLNVAIYGLRQALRQARPSFSHILFQDDYYLISPELETWVDFEAFEHHVSTGKTRERQGDLDAAVREYRAAEALYQGEFFEEDRYEDWLIPRRQSLCNDYLCLLNRLSLYYFAQGDYDACATVCNNLLTADACSEKAHRQLMRCYSRQGQPYLALRQYHQCMEMLKQGLDVCPSQETISLYEQIRSAKRV